MHDNINEFEKINDLFMTRKNLLEIINNKKKIYDRYKYNSIPEIIYSQQDLCKSKALLQINLDKHKSYLLEMRELESDLLNIEHELEYLMIRGIWYKVSDGFFRLDRYGFWHFKIPKLFQLSKKTKQK